MRSSIVFALALASFVHALALPSTSKLEAREDVKARVVGGADLAVSMDFYDRDQDIIYPDVYTDDK